MPRRPLPEDVQPDAYVEVANRLNSAAIHLLRRISRDDGADGVTGARLSALSVLVFGGAQSLSQLARREGVAAPTMSRIVDGLARDGFVERTTIEDDRRQHFLGVIAQFYLAHIRARGHERFCEDRELHDDQFVVSPNEGTQ